jgi:16S rRNA (uracil1498-N3)-methyltransferase
MTGRRFYVADLPAEGAAFALPQAVMHHARHVLRLDAGASVRLFDGQGHEAEARVERVTRKAMTVRVGAAVPSPGEPSIRIVLGIAWLKGDLMSLVVQKATELGVAAVWPVVTARTERRLRSTEAHAQRERLDRIAIAAAEQSGRARVPEVFPATDLANLLARPFEGSRLVFCERGPGWSLARLPERPHEVLLLIGPAGGWDEVELTRAAEAGCVPVTLGQRVLRAETAALAAVTLAQALWGDFRPMPCPGRDAVE